MSKQPAKQKTLFQAWHGMSDLGKSSPSNSQKDMRGGGQTLTAQEAVELMSDPIDLTDDDLIEAAEMFESTMSGIPGTSGISNKPIEHIPGFDNSLGHIWIYPTNYPVRDYQFSIVKKALFKNTLVSLPTGLGKTFIAAVVMYNFYRWYPQGKIVFMAPTKPLVSQQIEACYKIMGIPLEDQAEITGMTTSVHKREALWSSKRVFFLTPQVINNDLARGVCPASHIKCVVIDEAHKAQGNHAYCQVVKQLASTSRGFRVLALSATPGTDVKSVQMVINNLLISHIEIRSEDSIDIQSFSHQRKVEKIVCKLDETMMNMKNNYLKVIEIFTKSLVNRKALFDRETSSYSKYGLLMARNQFRKAPPSGLNKYEIGSIEGDFATCISLFHGLELLQQHGMRSFFIFLKAMMEGDKGNMRAKSVLGANTSFHDMYRDLLNMFGESPNSTVLLTQAGQTQQSFKQGNRFIQTTNYVYSHPKIRKLEEVVLTHFRNFKQSHDTDTTRVMVFCQYRDSVQEITELLQKHRPLVRPMQFVGHSTASGKVTKFTQKDQLMVVSKFRDGGYNTLISTCVGEEGLDIGDVDLIVCFDAHKSPIRLVQRMGRTGRKRKGRIIMLVTEGKEERDYNSSLFNKRSIQKAITGNSGRNLQFYQHSPRMIPMGLDPKPFKMFIKVHPKSENHAGTKENKKKIVKKPENADISMMLKNVGNQNSVFLNYDQIREWDEKLKLSVKEKEKLKIPPAYTSHMMCLGETRHNNIKSPARKQPQLSLEEWTIWQTRLQSSNLSGHSISTTNFVEMMEICDLIKGSDEKSFEENFAPFLGGKYNKSKMDADRKTKMDSFLVPTGKTLKREKETKKLTEKIKNILKNDKLSPEFSTDTDFVTEVPKKIFPQRNYKNELAVFACEDDNFETVNGVKDDTLSGIDSILHDRESTSFTADHVNIEQNDETNDVLENHEMECLPDFDMGGWGSDDNSDNESKNEIGGTDGFKKPVEMVKERNTAETKSLVKSKIKKISNDKTDMVQSLHCEKNLDLLNIVESISALPTQTPIVAQKNVNCTANMKPPTPPSLDLISFDFLDDFDFETNEMTEKDVKPKKRACFDIGGEDDLSKYESENGSIKKVVSDTTNQSKNGAGEEGGFQNCENDKFHTKHDETSSGIDAEVAVSLDASADMFDVDFDLGGLDDESFDCKNPLTASPVSTNKIANFPDTQTFCTAHENRDFNDDSHSSLAYITLTQRVENRALFSEFPKSQSDVNIPVAEVKPQRASSFSNIEARSSQSESNGQVSAHDNSESVLPTSLKRKRSNDADIGKDPSLVKRCKQRDSTLFASPVQGVISRHDILQTPKSRIFSTDSDESPILARKKRNLNNKRIFSPESDLSQKATISNKNEDGFMRKTSDNKKVLNFRPDESPISIPHKRTETSMKNKHSTPKCLPRDFKESEFSDEGEEDFSEVQNKRTWGKNTKNIKSKKSLPAGKMQWRRRLGDFVDDEAEVSDDGAQVSSDENESCGHDTLEEMREFVNDAMQLTQHVGQNESTIDEQAMYLQNKSDFFGEPAKFEGHNGKFKLAYGIGEGIDVFSQEVPSDVSGYAEDSFVCDDEIDNDADDMTALGEVTLLQDVNNTSVLKQRVTRRQAELNRLKKLNYEASPVLPAVTKLKKQTKIVDKPKRKRIICMDESVESVAESLNEVTRNDGSITWECSVCTLLNKEASQICELCDSEKPDSKLDSKKEKIDSEKWTCKMCTYVNHGNLKKCNMCGELFVSRTKQIRLENTSNTTQKMNFEKAVTKENNVELSTTKTLTPVKYMEIDIESDIISATPASVQKNPAQSEKSNVNSSLSSTAADAKFQVPTHSSLASVPPPLHSSSMNEEREERLRRCREKQMEFRTRMEKRRSLQDGSKNLGKSVPTPTPSNSCAISKTTPCRKTQKLMSSIKTSLQFSSPTASDVINSSITSPTVQESHDKGNKNVIFVDSKELSSCQSIITSLRSKHNIHVVVASLPHCDYIIGRGTAVERKMVFDFSQVANRHKLVTRFQQLNISYDRVYLIIEQDRVKKGDMSAGRPTHSSHHVSTVCALSQTSVRILYSDNQEETAGLLHILSTREKNLKKSIELDVAEKATDVNYRSALRLYTSIPKVSFVSALYMCKNFGNVKEVACSSVEKLMHKAHLSTCAAAEVYSYFRRNFDLQMTPSR